MIVHDITITNGRSKMTDVMTAEEGASAARQTAVHAPYLQARLFGWKPLIDLVTTARPEDIERLDDWARHVAGRLSEDGPVQVSQIGVVLRLR